MSAAFDPMYESVYERKILLILEEGSYLINIRGAEGKVVLMMQMQSILHI